MQRGNGQKPSGLCIRAVEVDPWHLYRVPDYFTQEMCDKAFEEGPSSLIYILDWFVRSQQVTLWHDGYYNDDNHDEVIG